MGEFEISPTNTTPFAQLLRAITGAAPDEPVHVTTPTFQRPSNLPPVMIAPSAAAFSQLLHLPAAELRHWGLLPWGGFSTEPDTRRADRVSPVGAAYFPLDDDDDPRTETHVLWLLPGKWYADIPRGFPIVDINGALEDFEPGKTDDDIRYGCLAYGIMIPKA